MEIFMLMLIKIYDKYERKGFADYIAKPFSKMQIEEKMDKVFKEKDILDQEQDDIFY